MLHGLSKRGASLTSVDCLFDTQLSTIVPFSYRFQDILSRNYFDASQHRTHLRHRLYLDSPVSRRTRLSRSLPCPFPCSLWRISLAATSEIELPVWGSTESLLSGSSQQSKTFNLFNSSMVKVRISLPFLQYSRVAKRSEGLRLKGRKQHL